MSLSLILIIVIVVAVMALVAFIVTRPDSFRLERSILIQARPEAIYPLVADFHRWTAWSPFEKMDAETKRTYGGPDSGVGATYGWQGDKTGVGHMEILEAEAPSRVLIKLDFLKPFEAHNMAQFSFTPEAGGTRASWAMFGPNTLMTKAMSLVFNMEKMTGPMFEQGLADMKVAAEAA